MNIQRMLSDFCDSLEQEDIKLCKSYRTKTLIFENLAKLKDTAKYCSQEKDIWKYDLSPLKIKLPKKPQCRPDNIKNIEITLEVGNEIFLSNKKNLISDPIKLLKFNIQVKCSKTNNLCSWHLDKHSQLPNNEDIDNRYIHPEYHFTYGGRKMKGLDLGKTLLLTSPRLMHPPLDVILGIDFIINQFITNEYSKYFTVNPTYQKIVSKMKELLWKPYTLALANNFYKEWSGDLDFEEGYSELLFG